MALVDARIFRRIVPFWKHLSKRYLGGKVPRPVELSPSPPGAGTDPAHISRPVLEAELKTLIRRRVSLAIFGPPRQGKSNCSPWVVTAPVGYALGSLAREPSGPASIILDTVTVGSIPNAG